LCELCGAIEPKLLLIRSPLASIHTFLWKIGRMKKSGIVSCLEHSLSIIYYKST
jgi:hypothetical protein